MKIREARALKLLEVDDAIVEIVNGLKDRGFQSPYIKAFVVARVNPIRFHRGDPPPFDETLERMLQSARRFNLGKVKESDISRTGGPPPAPES